MGIVLSEMGVKCSKFLKTTRMEKRHDLFTLRTLQEGDLSHLSSYLFSLGPESKSRFVPHPYDEKGLRMFYERMGKQIWPVIAVENATTYLIAYSIVYRGIFPHDLKRYQTYQAGANPEKDVTFAPSVADYWLRKGIGTAMFHYCKQRLQEEGVERIWLWGGVQESNTGATQYYRKLGFRQVGSFHHFGLNHDMYFPLGEL